MTPDFRALCAELADALANHCGDNEFSWGFIDRARAALAEPQPPADGEVVVSERLQIMAAGIRYGYMAGHDDTVEARYGDPDQLAADYAPEILRELTIVPALAEPEPPADGEVADAVKPSPSDVTELFYRHMGEGSEVGFEYAIAEALARWGRA